MKGNVLCVISSVSVFLLMNVLRIHNIVTVCRVLWKKNEVADYEATTFSIFYNNALFLMLVILASFYVLPSFTPPLYPLVWRIKNIKVFMSKYVMVLNSIPGITLFQ